MISAALTVFSAVGSMLPILTSPHITTAVAVPAIAGAGFAVRAFAQHAFVQRIQSMQSPELTFSPELTSMPIGQEREQFPQEVQAEAFFFIL